MPQALALIPLLIGAAGVGTSVYQLAKGGPSAPKAPPGPTPEQQAATATKTRQSQENALTQQLPGLQAQVGGSLSPEALLRLATIRSGQGGDTGINAALQDLLMKMASGVSVTSGGGGGTTGTTPTTGLTATTFG